MSSLPKVISWVISMSQCHSNGLFVCYCCVTNVMLLSYNHILSTITMLITIPSHSHYRSLFLNAFSLSLGQEIVQFYGLRWFNFHDNIVAGNSDNPPNITRSIFGWISQLVSRIASHFSTQFPGQIASQIALGTDRKKPARASRHVQSNSQSNSQSNLGRSAGHVRLPGCPTMTTGMFPLKYSGQIT